VTVSELVFDECCIHSPNLLDEFLVENPDSDPLLHELPPAHAANVPVWIKDSDYHLRNIPVD